MMMIALDQFCDPEQTRYSIQKPWRDGDDVIATDGIILVVCRADLYQGEVATEGKFQKWRDVIYGNEGIKKVSEWLPLPEFKKCSDCKGSGKVTEDCDACYGSGICTCDCGDEHGCHKCYETGERTRPCDCNVLFGNRSIALAYANKLKTLPGLTWGVVTDKAGDPIFFRFDGGSGALMPIREHAQG